MEHNTSATGKVDIEKYLIRCFHAKSCPWVVADLIHRRLNVALRNSGEVAAFGKIVEMRPFAMWTCDGVARFRPLG